MLSSTTCIFLLATAVSLIHADVQGHVLALTMTVHLFRVVEQFICILVTTALLLYQEGLLELASGTDFFFLFFCCSLILSYIISVRA